jgi:acyl-CoA synthetase (AMP-forming)/AMP-acid ligase II
MRTNLDTTTPHTQSTGHLDSTDFLTEPFSFTILACSAFSVHDVKKLRELAGIPLPTDPYVGEEGNTNLIETNSFHLIGLEDDFKAKSEEIASLFKGGQIMYLPGGHSIGREERLDDELCSALKDFTRSLGNSPSSANIANFNRVSNVSSIALHPHKQVAEVMLDTQRLPEGIHAKKGGATILALFQAQPKNQPFLYDARNPSGIASTYGDVASFICGGDGDLRRLGVKSGEVVAYGAPPGGSAAAALAFLSIGAQTAAAPLAPGMTEPEALDALLQFDARHVILFEGVDCPGIEAAFLKYTSSYGKASIHRARIIGDDFPGMFEYIDSKVSLKKERPNEPLRNPANGTCLLLRTSGTTARPKGVPLEQGALVNNGAIIASSMGLQETDVCYSVMPLFHIGGISASILCTLASGGSVCCDGKPYDPGRMVDALVLSNPQPTWYSSVPTIHNATVSFMKDQAALDPKYKAYGIDSSGVWTKGHSLRMIRSGAATLLGPDGEALAAAYGGVPIYPTYSMSEQVSTGVPIDVNGIVTLDSSPTSVSVTFLFLFFFFLQMPISQPPAGKADMLSDKPASVGVPVAASLAIVSRSTLRPQPHGAEGEIAISGPTVLKNYLDNPNADRKSYFFLTQKGDDAKPRYFLTGDVGLLDSDGFLSLKGRAKELIKKGGEQGSFFWVTNLHCQCFQPLLTTRSRVIALDQYLHSRSKNPCWTIPGCKFRCVLPFGPSSMVRKSGVPWCCRQKLP